jgi:hypothetical protein
VALAIKACWFVLLGLLLLGLFASARVLFRNEQAELADA